MQRWDETDWGTRPLTHVDAAEEKEGEKWGTAGRARRLPTAFATMLRAATADAGDPEEWLFFIEDDLAFHPMLLSLVRSWVALGDARCVLASLFNPSLQPALHGPLLDRSLAVTPASFLGAQALFVRRRAVAVALAGWETVRGMQAQRLALLLGGEGPLWVHRPSLVQHVAVDSSWGARVQTALDFNPKWLG